MPWPWLNSWSFGNTGIATSYGDSTTTGVGDGNTAFYASFPGVEYHVEGTDSGWYCALDQTPIPAQTGVTTQCSVAAVTAHDPDPLGIDINGMNQDTQTALTCLQTAVSNASGTLTVTSAYRPQTYQDHLREVWDKWQAIKNNTQNACQERKTQIQTEWDRHQLAFQPATTSNHTAGNAFDATWTPNTLDIDVLAKACNLSRPVSGDPVHFVR